MYNEIIVIITIMKLGTYIVKFVIAIKLLVTKNTGTIISLKYIGHIIFYFIRALIYVYIQFCYNATSII